MFQLLDPEDHVLVILPGRKAAPPEPLLDRSESAAREANDVLTAAKRVWPISDSFKDMGDGMLPIDSFEARGKGSTR